MKTFAQLCALNTIAEAYAYLGVYGFGIGFCPALLHSIHGTATVLCAVVLGSVYVLYCSEVGITLRSSMALVAGILLGHLCV